MQNRIKVVKLLIHLTLAVSGNDAESQSVDNVVKDIDGNLYHTVKIGTQIWMVENLKATHYRNGDPVLHVTDNKEWDQLRSGGWCYYGNDSSNNKLFGKLYNFYAVMDKRNIAPPGWHIPSNGEWDILVNYLGKEEFAGGKMKESGNVHWDMPNINATNESRFTGLPGGFRFDYGEFYYLKQHGYWWNATYAQDTDEKIRILSYTDGALIEHPYPFREWGVSVRCIKD